MSERYVRPTVGGWLRPTLIAPWLSTYGAVTAIALLGIDRGLFGKGVAWALGMTIGTVWAFVYCLMLVVVDLLLLGVKVRTLPAGRRGWAAAFVSPLAVFGAYIVVPPYKFYAYGPWALAAAVLLPMLVAATATRVLTGVKPPR
jgi:hypothetical protein